MHLLVAQKNQIPVATNATPKYATKIAMQNIFIITAHLFFFSYPWQTRNQKGKKPACVPE
jgi:hypothetical protein|tara:strand:- start:11133 stop:11312 length:180 start_codon:yes stop_codon:yes gene_type:complete